MNLDQLRAFCLSLPHTTEQIQWQDHLLFKVAGKMFLITTPDDPALPLSLKSTDGEFEEWIEREGIIPAPYMARNKWIRLESTRTVTSNELRQLVTRSYQLVVANLPKKHQAMLGGGMTKPTTGRKQAPRPKAAAEKTTKKKPIPKKKAVAKGEATKQKVAASRAR